MALTITKVKLFNVVRDGVRDGIFDITCDNSYPAGGYVLTATSFGLKGLYLGAPLNSPGGFVFSFDTVAGKLWAYKVGAAGPMVEVGATDINTKVVRVEVRGW